MMILKLDEVIEILQQEINWCLDHPDSKLNKDQQMGFMNGLRQAQILIQNAERKIEHDRKSYCSCGDTPCTCPF